MGGRKGESVAALCSHDGAKVIMAIKMLVDLYGVTVR